MPFSYYILDVRTICYIICTILATKRNNIFTERLTGLLAQTQALSKWTRLSFAPMFLFRCRSVCFFCLSLAVFCHCFTIPFWFWHNCQSFRRYLDLISLLSFCVANRRQHFTNANTRNKERDNRNERKWNRIGFHFVVFMNSIRQNSCIYKIWFKLIVQVIYIE